MIKTEEMEKLPEGWKRVRLGEIVEISDNRRVPLDSEYRATIKGDFPYCGATGIIDYINDYIFNGEYLLIAEDGGNFNRFEETAYIMRGKFWVNNHVHILKGKNGILDNSFLMYFVNFQDVSRYISGSTREKLNQRLLKSVEIPLPPLPEQQKIAEILETVDNVIEKTDAIIEKYKRIKQGLMQDLLTRGIIENYELGIMNYGSELRKHESGIMNDRLGVVSHESEIGNWELRDERKHKFKDSPLGKIPEEWEVVSLEEVALPNGIVRGPFGGMLKKEIFVSRGYKVYEQGNAIYKSVNLGHYSIDAKKYKQMLRFAVKPKDFIISCSGTIGKIFMIPDNFKKGIINQALLKITIDNKKFNHKFFEYFFEWERFQDKIIDYTQGGAMPNLIGINEFKKVSFPKPPLPEQRRIASILSQVDEVIEKEQKYKEKLERIKRGLMKDLLTGRIRVNSLIEHGYIENGK